MIRDLHALIGAEPKWLWSIGLLENAEFRTERRASFRSIPELASVGLRMKLGIKVNVISTETDILSELVREEPHDISLSSSLLISV